MRQPIRPLGVSLAVVVAALWVPLAAPLPVLAAPPTKTLWQIGQSDNDTRELALAPDGFSNIEGGGFFVVGRSEAKKDWPYAHPGPADRWAGEAARIFHIYFGLEEQPKGSCRLVIDLADTHKLRPPTLKIIVNGRSFAHATPPGGGDASIFGSPDKGREHRFSIDVQAGLLRAGLNEIRIVNAAKSWFLYDAVGFEAPPTAELAPAEGTLVRQVRLDPWLVRSGGKPWHEVAVTLVRVGGPGEVVLDMPGAKPVRKRVVPGEQEVRVLRPPVEAETAVDVSIREGERVIDTRKLVLRPSRERQPVDWVDCMLGTANSRWMLYPGPSMPFSLVKLSPDNEDHPKTWYKGGHDYTIENIAGFSHIHSWTLGGLLTVPTTGPLATKPGPQNEPDKGYRSRYRHATEEASPGYYAVTLDDYGVCAELTSTMRCGVQRYTFPKADEARVLFDLAIPTEYYVDVLGAEVRQKSATEIEGFCTQRCRYYSGGADVYTVHFAAELSKPMAEFGGWIDDRVIRGQKRIACGGDDPNVDIGAFAELSTSEGEQVILRTGISLVSVEQAWLNLKTEMKPFEGDFDKVRRHARETWNDLLGKIRIEGGTAAERTKFYTNFYRSYCARTTFSDVNGKYVDMYERVQQLENPDDAVLGCDAFWNTFWNLNQLWILVTPDVASQWVRSLLEIDRVGGWLPKGPAGVEYTSIMVASHEIALIVAAYQHGIRDFDVDHAWRAIQHIQTTPDQKHEGGGEVGNEKLADYMKHGFMPVEAGPVSNTLEFAYDDWCAAQLARALGKEDDYRYFMKRAENWRNVFDPRTGYARPRHRDGRWLDPFDPFHHKHYVEGNAWQYTWFVPHDVPALVEVLGREEFNRRLEEGFEKARPRFVSRYVNHGNQPNMQAAWLFNFSGKPWLTQYWVRRILDTYYGLGPVDGYPGDEDQGQMGAWYVMSAMGLFQMDGGCAVEPGYSLASPLFDRIAIRLDPEYFPGRELVIETVNNAPENCYVQSVRFNGKPITRPWIAAKDLLGGGRLVIELGPEPNHEWGTEE